MSPRLRRVLLLGSFLIVALELPDLTELLRHDLFAPRPELLSAGELRPALARASLGDEVARALPSGGHGGR